MFGMTEERLGEILNGLIKIGEVSVIYPEEGTVWLPTGTAIVKNCPHPENAKKFIDFLLSEECQQLSALCTLNSAL